MSSRVTILAIALLNVLVGQLVAQEKISITADFSKLDPDRSRKVGIGVNFLSDSPDIADQLVQLNVKCIRYATTEYTQFRTQSPKSLGVAIPDPALWPVQKFTDLEKWYSKLDFDQFIELCRKTQAEPCVVLPMDAIVYSGDKNAISTEEVIRSAADWVRYANVEKGYKVQHWELGNESDLVSTPLVKWSAETYAKAVNRISRAMKEVDPSIQIGVNGMRTGQEQPWWDEVLPRVREQADFLVTHQYSWLTSYDKWRVDPSRYDYNVSDAITATRKHKLSHPIYVTEVSGFNPAAKQPNCVWKALHSFEVVGNVLSHPQVDSAFFWTSKWLGKNDNSEDVNALNSRNELTAMGRMLQVWCRHGQGDVAQCPDNSGVRVWYSSQPDGTSCLFVLNKGSHAVDATIATKGLSTSANVASASHFTTDSPDAFEFKESPLAVEGLASKQLRMPLPALSLGVIVVGESE